MAYLVYTQNVIGNPNRHPAINQHFDIDAIFIEDDGSYAEVLDGNGKKWALHASGDGDFVSHRIRFEALS